MASFALPDTPALPAPPVAQQSAVELDALLGRAHTAFRGFRHMAISARTALLARVAELLEHDVETYAALLTREMGKTLVSARAEVRKCATACRFYAEHGEAMMADEAAASGYMRSRVCFQPLGPILAIMPWNFPFWQVFRCAAPALVAGNTVLLKHAPNVPGCSAALEALFTRAGFPDGTFVSLFMDTSAVAGIIADPRVAAVTLTGSERAGSAVAAQAGHAIKKVVLELGGSDPFLVMPSADQGTALAAAVQSRMLNNGQSCIAAKRILLHRSIYDQALADLTRRVEALKVGDPCEPATDIGPLALERFADHLEDQVHRALAAGARVEVGGGRHALGGAFFQPTILTGLPRTAEVAREEFFGPVMLVDHFDTLDEAIEIANDSPFGLAASVWTRIDTEQQRFIDELEVGQVFINAITASDPRIPFGGIKRSGLGRELGVYGIREFTNIKSVSFG